MPFVTQRLSRERPRLDHYVILGRLSAVKAGKGIQGPPGSAVDPYGGQCQNMGNDALQPLAPLPLASLGRG
jgi:hypothetical protein